MISKNVDPFIDYNGDNIASTFGIPFPTFEIESLITYVTEIATGTQTTIVVNADFTAKDLGVNGVEGSITLIDSGQAWLNAGKLSSDYSIHIYFDSEAFQPGAFRQLGNYSPITLESTLDRLTMNVKAILKKVEDSIGQIPQMLIDIAANTSAIAVNAAAIVGLDLRLGIVETKIASTKEVISDSATGAALLATINEAVDEDMIFEYIIKRGGTYQYGRELVMDLSPFNISQVEKLGNSGVTFSITESGGIGTIRYTSTALAAGTIQYRLYKFTK